jgi:hypothetical protein
MKQTVPAKKTSASTNFSRGRPGEKGTEKSVAEKEATE